MNQPNEKELAESLEYVRDVTWTLGHPIATPVELIAAQMKIHGMRIATALDATLGAIDTMSQAYAGKVIELENQEPLRKAAVDYHNADVTSVGTRAKELLQAARKWAEKGEADAC